MPARAHENSFCGTADEAEAFAAELVKAARKARAQAPRKPIPAPIDHLPY